MGSCTNCQGSLYYGAYCDMCAERMAREAMQERVSSILRAIGQPSKCKWCDDEIVFAKVQRGKGNYKWLVFSWDGNHHKCRDGDA